jgi:thiosulfate/3-mercaptopyruvate sulfurtransferase
MMQRARWFGSLLLICLLAGCGGSSTTPSGTTKDPADPAHSRLLQSEPATAVVGVDQAAGRRGFPNVVFLAATSKLSQQRPGFVEGAENVDVDEWTLASEGPSGFSDTSGWAQRIGGLGLTPQSEVYVYDGGEMRFASRIRFLLWHFGVSHAHLVNGGYAALQYWLPSQAQPGTLAPTVYTPTVNNWPIQLVDRAQVLADLGQPNVFIVDVRTPAEYNGAVVLPGDLQAGHIPGAINVPIANFFIGTEAVPLLGGSSQVKTQLLTAGVTLSGPVIFYCHDGAKSSLAATLAADAGVGPVMLYYDSWIDWSANSSDPIAQ